MFFEALLAGVDEVGCDLALHLSPGVLGNRDTAGLGDAFDPRGDIDAVAEDIVAFDNDVADIDPDPKPDRIGPAPLGSRSRTRLWISIAQITASTALANSTSTPSPISLTIRPEWAAIAGSMRSRRRAFRRDSVPASSMPIRRE